MYTKNLQGDVTSIVNESGNTILNYTYDAWGNVSFSATSMQNMMLAYTLAYVSPFTYRGYCYDYDIELYYLQSRYYSAEIGRFINTDDTNIAIQTVGRPLGNNLFAYCENNPVNDIDFSGYVAGSLIAKVLLGVLSQYAGDIISNIINGKTGKKVFIPHSSLSTYIAAGLSALVGGNRLLSSIGRAAISTAANYIQSYIRGDKQNVKTVVFNLIRNIIIDYVCSFITKIAIKKINSLSPRNYSSFARSQYLKNAKITPSQIRSKMASTIRFNIFSVNAVSFLSGSVAKAF